MRSEAEEMVRLLGGVILIVLVSGIVISIMLDMRVKMMMDAGYVLVAAVPEHWVKVASWTAEVVK